jgi:hypothetical protein
MNEIINKAEIADEPIEAVEERKDPIEMIDFEDEAIKALMKREDLLFKANIPEDYDAYRSGNGEGCWWRPLHPKDLKKALGNTSNKEKFMAILCNDSIYFMGLLRFGHIIQLETRGSDRAVMDVKWLNEKVGVEVFKV